MTGIISSRATKELVLRFILDSIDYRKRCEYLQEIIFMSRINDTWRRALLTFFDTPLEIIPVKVFSTN